MGYAAYTNPGFAGSGAATERDYIAGVIQGEAATPEGQLAVASVIQNRAAIGFGGQSTPLGVVQAKLQFDGYNPNPSPTAYAAYDAAIGQGNVNTNALNYANPTVLGISPNSWARGLNSSNSLNIGGEGNLFTTSADNPSIPSYTPGGIKGTDTSNPGGAVDNNPQGSGQMYYVSPNTADHIQDNQQDSGAGWSDSAFSGGSGIDPGNVAPQGTQHIVTSANPSENTPDNPDGSISLSDITVSKDTVPTTSSSGAPTGSSGNTPVDGTYSVTDEGPSSGSSLPSINTGTPQSASGFGQQGSGIDPSNLPGPLGSMLNTPPASVTPSQGGVLSGMWEMMGVTAVTSAGQQQAQATQASGTTIANAVQAAASQTNKTNSDNTAATNATSQADTTAAIGAAGSYANSWLDTFKDLFVRGWLGFFGIILIAGAVLYFMRKPAEEVVVAAAKDA